MSNVETMETADRFSVSALVEARIQYRLARGNRMVPIPFVAEDYPVVSDDWLVQVRYWAIRLEGESHNMAEVLATRAFPGLRTDALFNLGRVNGNQFEAQPWMGDYYKQRAEAAGVNTTGKYYSRALADYPGDPTAWVSDRGDVLRVCKEKGYRCTGLVDYEPPPVVPIPDVAIASDLVEEEIARRLSFDPGLTREDVFDDAYNTRAGKVDVAPAWEPVGPDLSEVVADE